MKEEIKEILDYLKETDNKDIYGYVKDKILAYEEGVKLLDYIINLQEENEYSNHCNEELRKKITNLEYKIDRLENELKGDNK